MIIVYLPRRAKVPSLRFRIDYLWRKSLGVLRSRLGLTVTIGLLGIWIALFSVVFGPSLSKGGFPSTLYAIVFFITLGSIWVVASVVAMVKLSAEEMAQITVANRKVSDAWQIASFEIWRLCAAFTRNRHVNLIKEEIKALEIQLPQLGEDIAARIERIDACHRALRLLALRQQRSIDFAMALKRRIADEYGIPARRLCDYVFQFSPAIYQNRLAKYLSNLRQLSRICRNPNKKNELDDSQFRQLTTLIQENSLFNEKVIKSIDIQERLLEYTDLHSQIQKFGSRHSSSGSVLEYASAISACAGSNLDLQSLNDKLIFLYFKQRVHPGFDLNRACINLAERLGDATLARCLERLSMHESRMQNEREGQNIVNAEQRSNLRDFYDQAVDYLFESRENIAGQFESIYSQFAAESNAAASETIILTYGYSNVVNDVLWSAIPNPENSSEGPRIFVMLSDDVDSFDSRLMEYKLKENREHRGRSRLKKRANIAAGDESVLLKLVKERTRFLILLGAECFDDEGRIIHPRGFSDRLSALVNSINEMIERKFASGLKVVIVAEGYKHHPSLIEVREFYRDNLTDVECYEASLQATIIEERSE